jgi:twinkle protein
MNRFLEFKLDHNYQYGLPALSVPFGGGGGNKQRWVEYEFDRLAIFDRIYLCLDEDKEGLIATRELVERLGRHRCHIVKLPHKDANECLQANVPREIMQQCFDLAITLDPEELKSASEFVDQVIDEFYPAPGVHLGYDAPWEKTQGKILFRPDELSVWTGINGHGKSQFLGQIILHAMKQGARVCIASLELKPKRLLMRLTRQAGALAEPTEEYIRAIHTWYEDKLWLFDLVGTAKSKRLLDVFLYARQRYNIDVFVIDSFMKLDIAEDDYKAQK